MLYTLNDALINEESFLATYALKNKYSRGRRYKEESHPLRTDFQRDRDRIIHNPPFRRLENKTQVFLNGTGDHFRTRLTHTLEVALISRTIARALRLNEDLAEAIALAHDLGHTPFGHTGERKLNTLLNKHDESFEHNKQSLKIVDELIKKYPRFNGINLTWETRCGLIKHREKQPVVLDDQLLPISPSLEAQVADVADTIAYCCHDVDDGLTYNLLKEEELDELKIWQNILKIENKVGIGKRSEKFYPYAIRCLVDKMVVDVIMHSNKLLLEFSVVTPEDAQNIKRKIITFSPVIKEQVAELKRFLYKHVYKNKIVAKVNLKSERILEALFDYYCNKPDRMGKSAQKRIAISGIYVAVADYIAGMTDQFAINEYKKI